MTTYPTPIDPLLGLDDWSALPEDTSRRIELAEGVLQVSPRPVWRHQVLVGDLVAQLNTRSGGRCRAAPEFEVVVDGHGAATVRVPDVVVLPPGVAGDTPRVEGHRLVAAFEVLSPGTRRLDRVVKRDEYAEAGVASYVLVDPGPPVTMEELELVGRRYEIVGEHHGCAKLRFGAVVDLTIMG